MSRSFKIISYIVLCIVLSLGVLCMAVCAEDNKMPDGYKDFIDALPDGSTDGLPEGFFSEDAGDVADAVSEMSGVEYLFALLLNCFGKALSRVLPHLVLLLGMLIISSIGSMLAAHLSPSSGKAFEICSRLAMFGVIGGVASQVLGDTVKFFESLSGTVAAFIPLSATLYTIGGNVGTALKSSTGLLVTLGIVEFISGVVVVPLFCFCLALSLISCMSSDVGGGGVGGAVKKMFMNALGVITIILSVSLASQTLIASKADTLAMKGAKMFLGGIPVTGGTVSSSLGTLASSISLIRSAVGIGGIIILMIILLPTIVELWLIRSIYTLLAGFSGILGMTGEQKLMSEVSELYGILEGVVIMCSVVFVVSMSLLCASVPAISP